MEPLKRHLTRLQRLKCSYQSTYEEYGTMNQMQALSFMRRGGAEPSTSKMVRELHYPS